ncbi:protein SMAX1-LIKE 7-like [Tasmannia lanceolata]|uniref:protein SMAX1-LIKE 7-like n=1 Tax=Tasmannia lanceolata TaxID=3420 RepID=UPI004062DD09
MPTPVSSAREILTGEAAAALDEAVGVARRRGHAQTTSLHAVSALLALPSSALREACARARSSAFSPRLQFRALELSFVVALDRLPSSQTLDEPPISNSLMAAIKRSQANQRRTPDSFQFLQQQQNQQSSILCVKVELKQLILSILDDPVVSRVFGEAGFRSYDVKIAIVRPPAVRLRPPIFLCNFDSELGRRNFNFPFSGFDEFDENCKRIGEVLFRKKNRNPLLIGVLAKDAVRNFVDWVQRGDGSAFVGQEMSGLKLKFICIEKEVLQIGVSGGEGLLVSRFAELGRLAGSGVVVNVGDLKGFLGDGMRFVVAELTRLLDVHRGRLWLIGVATNYDTYMKFLSCYPSVEKDWDIQPLPISSVRPPMGGFHPKPNSLMESFVPFGGFFSTASDLRSPLSNTYQSMVRCHLCNEKYEQEVSAMLKGSTVSASDQRKESLPSWLQRAEIFSVNKGLDVAMAKDGGTVLNAKVMELQKKWNDICQHIHPNSQMHGADIYRVGAQVHPGIVGLPYVTDRKERADNHDKGTDLSQSHSGDGNVFSLSTDLQKISSPQETIPTTVATDLVLGIVDAPLCKEQKKHSFQTHKERLQNFTGCLPAEVDAINESIPIAPVHSSSCSAFSNHVVANAHLPMRTYQSSNPMRDNAGANDSRGLDSSSMSGHFDPRDFKMLWRGLTERVGCQDEAICAICQTIARCGMGNERCRGANPKGVIWLSFLGPDRVAKRKIAVALAEMVFGSRENIISVDVNSRVGISQSNTIFDLGKEINGYDVKYRGNPLVDYIFGEISRKPPSVVFLENVDKADLLLQDSLSRAVNTGKFSNSHGREVGVNNAIFVTTTTIAVKAKTFFTGKDCCSFSEERILAAQDWKMQILIRHISETSTNNSSNVAVISQNESKNKQTTSGQVFINKRKLDEHDNKPHSKRVHRASNIFLDLNMSIEEMEAIDMDNGDDENDRVSENTEAWLEEFFDSVDETVIFKPFDFDTLADNVLKKVSECFQKTIGSEVMLEIDSDVMEQILAASWLSDGMRVLEDWVEQVLGKSFAEARQRYTSLSANCVLKLVTCDERLMEERAPGVCLPARVTLN